jgi:uncharacterized protein YdeI (YjbR/CyaY-like superfamily)
MPKKDQRVDAYIAKSADFAKPILEHFRKVAHAACPDAEETIKWQFPTFVHQGLLCGMAAFKQHCRFAFWKQALVAKLDFNGNGNAKETLSRLWRISVLSDLPSDKEIIGIIQAAARLNEQGVKAPRAPSPRGKQILVVPPELSAALKKNKKAREAFENFSPSHRKEYIEWIIEAKREETRLKRLETTIAWLTEGKPRNWKYMNC